MATPYDTPFGRTELLVGTEGMARLRTACVAVFGLGGVGSYTVEALARAGVGRLLLIDFDTVAVSNLNRQLLALHTTVGRRKVDVARARIAEINPDAVVEVFPRFADAACIEEVLECGPGFVADAVDTVRSKVEIIVAARARGLFVVSCMGAASKLDPGGILTGDISETRVCPLARRVREELRGHGIRQGVQCVYSHENRARTFEDPDVVPGAGKRRIQGSISYVPAIAGLTAAGIIVRAILGELPG